MNNRVRVFETVLLLGFVVVMLGAFSMCATDTRFDELRAEVEMSVQEVKNRAPEWPCPEENPETYYQCMMDNVAWYSETMSLIYFLMGDVQGAQDQLNYAISRALTAWFWLEQQK